MSEKIKNTLSQYNTESKVIRELHDVPPYRVYEIQLGEQRKVLKIDDHERGHAADEGRIHEYVATNTSAAVPEIDAVGTDHYITTWHDEIADSSEQVESQWAHAAGVWLGTLHADTAGEFDGFGQLRNDTGNLELAGHKNWADAVTERISHHRPFLTSVGYGDVANAVEKFFREHPSVFDGIGGPVLCHGDVHPEHHVRSNREGTVAIDFEHALIAPAEYDYWRTVMPYFEARDDVDGNVKHAFQDGYESIRPFVEGFEHRRPLYRLINWVAFIESLYLQKTVEPEKRKKMGKGMRKRVFETLEEVHENQV